MNAGIEKYKITGKIFLWKYEENDRNYPGWNLTADHGGCDSLIKLLLMMKQSKYSSKKVIDIEPATKKQTSVANSGAPARSAQKLILNFRKDQMELWVLNSNGDVEIVFGNDKLDELETAIQKVKKNEGDFRITNDQGENVLSFWWLLK